MFSLEDLEAHYGKTMEINGATFTLEKIIEQSGTLAIWKYENEFVIMATPMFENVPVPVQVLQHGYEPLDDEWESIGEDSYPAEIDSFERYCNIVRVLSEKILRRMRM
jgi:hypothetical protein